MPVATISVRDFRGYREETASLGGGLTVVAGPNGAGKTNLLEAIYFGCTGRSCRTANERELVRFGCTTTRVVLGTESADGHHELAVGLTPGEAKQMTVDGARVEGMLGIPGRPLVSVFLPDRLELVKGVPALRRAHLDQYVAALWPGRAVHRRAYAAALAQRNALLTRLRAGEGSRSGLEAWDRQLALRALELMADRRDAVERTQGPFSDMCEHLSLDGNPSVGYRPRSRATDADSFMAELHERIDSDLERGFTGYGPHRDELLFSRDGRELRTYGSQGQQRLGLLAFLLAEREVLAGLRDEPPLMLLDDVMSELDGVRRAALIEVLAAHGGQALITTTDADHIPGAAEAGVTRVAIAAGHIVEDVVGVPG
jgi:DNA replication and repair protein RecF